MKRSGPEGGFEPREVKRQKVDPLEKQPAIEEYFEIVQEGPNKGKSEVWFLVNSDNIEGEANPFIAFWEQFSTAAPTAEQLSLFSRALFSKPAEGADAGVSAFSMLPSKVGHQYAIQIFEQFKQDVTLEDLLDDFLHVLLDHHYDAGSKTLLENLEKKKDEESIILCIVYLLNRNDIYLLRQILARFSEGFTSNLWSRILRELTYKSHTSPEMHELLITTLNYLNGKKLLSEVFKFFTANTIAALTPIVLEHFNGDGLDFDILVTRDGEAQYALQLIDDASVLLQIAKRFFMNKSINWFFSNNLLDTLAKFLTLLHCSEISEEDKTELQELSKQIDHTHLLSPIEGKTLLHHILTNFFSSKDLFLELWQKFEDKVEITDLIRHPADQPSIIRLLAVRVPSLIKPVFDKFGDKITLQYLMDETAISPLYSLPSTSTLYVLANAALSFSTKTRNVFISKMLEHKLRQDPGIISNESCLPWPSLYDYLNHILPMIKADELIRARNALFTNLSELNGKELSDENYKELMECGKAAFEAGYINAFYDIGQYYISRGQLLTGHQVLKNVLPESRHYQSVSSQLATYCLGAFTDCGIYDKKLLRKTLKYAIRIADENDHNQILKRIAYYYVFDDNKGKVTPDWVVPDSFLKAMNGITGVEGCIKLLEELKRIKLLEAQVTQLQAFTHSKRSVPVTTSKGEHLTSFSNKSS